MENSSVILLVIIGLLVAAIIGLVIRLVSVSKNQTLSAGKFDQLESRVNDLQLETLESKLNPHLFKNILNSIQSHAYQTYFALDKLANVLDYILYESRKKFVSPKEEIDIASALTKKQTNNTGITALHLSLSTEMHSFELKDYEKKVFAPVLVESEILEQPVFTKFKVSSDINTDITSHANHGEYDLLFIGLGQSIFEGTLLGKVLGFTTQIINPDRLIDKFTGREGLFENSPFDERTRHIVLSAKMPVGIYLDKGHEAFNRIFLPLFVAEDGFLIEFAQKFIHNNGAQVTVLDAVPDSKSTTEIRETIRHIEQIAPNHIATRSEKIVNKEFLNEQDLMLVSLDSWKKLVDSHSVWLTDTPSVLIIKP